ncbi:hypothetical protein DICA2_E01530 [Diutina catenulata]
MVVNKNYKELGREIRKHYWDTVNKAIELFPFDDPSTKDVLDSLPAAFGPTEIEDHGKPAPYPIEVYHEKLPAKVKEIVYMEPTKLIAEMQAGKLKVYDVIRYYMHAALFASRLVNCVYEFLPERALEQIKRLEKADAKKMPLYGLPLGVKEMVPLVGYAPTHGSPCYLDRVVDYDAQIVAIAEELGAVTFLRETNVQSLMALECESFGHGLTVNPLNSSLAPGGSSGGSGATAGLRASAVSLGSDIGGSIRSPAASCGIYGLRSTLGRLPTSDYFSCQRGSQSILSVTGPITRSLKMADLFMKSIIGAKPWLRDPALAPIEWKAPGQKKKFRVGFVEWDGNVMPHPPILRGIREVREKLSQNPNVEIVDFKQYGVDRSNELLAHLYFEDGGADTRGTTKSTGEPLIEQAQWAIEGTKKLEWPEQWEWNIKKDEFRKDYLKHWMSYTKDGEVLDAVIGPVYPSPAPKHKTARYWSYTSLYNTLDLPTLVVPVGTVDPAKDKPDSGYKPANEMDKFYHSIYDSAESYKNGAIAVGITGMRFTDETLFDIARLFAKDD